MVSYDQARCRAGQTWQAPSLDGPALAFSCTTLDGVEGPIPAAFANVEGAVFVQSWSLPHTTVFSNHGDFLGLWFRDDQDAPLLRGVWLAPSNGIASSSFVDAIANEAGCGAVPNVR